MADRASYVAPFPLGFNDFQRGLSAEDAGDLDRASARYRAVLRRLPGHVQATVHLAAVELARGRTGIMPFRRLTSSQRSKPPRGQSHQQNSAVKTL